MHTGTDRGGSSSDLARPDDDPLVHFCQVFEQALRVDGHDATAMALATSDERGRPAVRMIGLKYVDARGFTFFTNLGSRKARELDANPYAALCLHWRGLAQQVRAEGPVGRIPDEESDAYFATRPRANQIGAWASKQSAIVRARVDLEARAEAIAARFPGAVPRPPHWGGYRLTPARIEFWHARAGRLHERVLYVREGHAWAQVRLSP